MKKGHTVGMLQKKEGLKVLYWEYRVLTKAFSTQVSPPGWTAIVSFILLM